MSIGPTCVRASEWEPDPNMIACYGITMVGYWLLSFDDFWVPIMSLPGVFLVRTNLQVRLNHLRTSQLLYIGPTWIEAHQYTPARIRVLVAIPSGPLAIIFL